MDSNQRRSTISTTFDWAGLHDNLQDRVTSTLNSSDRCPLRATSRQCRQLVNRSMTSLHLRTSSARPTHTLDLPDRLPNLRKLTLEDEGCGLNAQNCLTETELLHIFTAPRRMQPWTQLTELDISRCSRLDPLVLSTVLKMLPNLQRLATQVPRSRNADAARAVARLSQLKDLQLHSSRTMGEYPLVPVLQADMAALSGLPSLQKLSTNGINWLAIQAVSALTTMTALVLKEITTYTSLSGYHSMVNEPLCLSFPLLGSLSHLVMLTISSAVIFFPALAAAIQSVASLRKLHMSHVRHGQTDTEAAPTFIAITQLQQLTDIDIYYVADGEEHVEFTFFDHIYALAGCLQLPNLEVLHIGSVYHAWDDAEIEHLMQHPATCASSLHTVELQEVGSQFLESNLLQSLAVKNLKMESYNFSGDVHRDSMVQGICTQTALQSLSLSIYRGSDLAFGDEGWKRIATSCRSMRNLSMWCMIGYEPLAGMSHLDQVQELSLHMPGLKDAGISELLYVPHLQLIDLHRCNMVTVHVIYALAANLSVKEIILPQHVSPDDCDLARKLVRLDLKIILA